MCTSDKEKLHIFNVLGFVENIWSYFISKLRIKNKYILHEQNEKTTKIFPFSHYFYICVCIFIWSNIQQKQQNCEIFKTV